MSSNTSSDSLSKVFGIPVVKKAGKDSARKNQSDLFVEEAYKTQELFSS